MIQRVYICINLNSPFVAKNYDQLEDYKVNNVVKPYSSSFVLLTQVKSKEEKHIFLIRTNLLQDSIDKDPMHFNQGEDMLQIWTSGHIISPNIVHSHYFGNLICRHVVQDRLQTKSTLRMAFRQEGEDDEDMTLMLTTMFGIWLGGVGG